MRILEIQSHSRIGGTEEHIRQLALGLEKKGCDVRVVLPPGPSLNDALRDSGIEVYENTLNWRERSDWISLWKVLHQFKPHIIHTHHRKADLMGGVSGKIFNYPVVTTLHDYLSLERWGYDSFAFNNRFYHWVLKNIPEQVICISNTVKTDFEKQVGKRENVIVIYNGVEIIDPLARSRGQMGVLKIGCVGRIISQKGQRDLLELFPKIRNICGDSIRVIFVGDGPDRSFLEQRIRDKGWEGCFEFRGVVTNKNFYEDFDIVIVPSRWEALGRVAFEALVAGVPVLAKRVGGIREAFEQIETVWLYSSNEELLAKLVWIVKNPEKVFEKIQKSRKKIIEHWRNERFVDRYYKLFTEINANKGEMSL